MLASEQTNSSPVKKNSPFMETVQDKLKDIKNFSNWSAKEQMIAVGAVGVMVGALLPFVAVALPVAATGAIVALTLFFAVKAVEYTFKGLKWSAEKTVDGAKYTAGKVKDASTYAAGKAREGYHSVKGAISSVRRATREGTGATLGKMGRSLSNLSESMSSLDAIPYSISNEGQTVVLKTEEKTRNFNSVKEMFIKEVLEDKAVNNSALTKEIFSKLGEKILEKAYSVGGPQGAKKDQLINQLKQQADFVNKLDAKKLQNLLSENNNNLYEIFSDHHDEIKEVIAKCKEDHILKRSLKMRNNMLEEGSARPSRSLFSSLGREDSERSNSLSRSSSLDSVRTESTASSEAELLNPAKHKEVKAPSSFREKMPLWLGGKKAPEEATNVKYQDLSEPDTSSRRVGESTFYVDTPTPIDNTDKTATIGAKRSRSNSLTPVAPPKVPGSPSIGSGRGSSGPSTPISLELEQPSKKDEVSAVMEQNLKEFSSSAKTDTHNSLSNRNGYDSGFNSPSSSVPSTPQRQSPSLGDLSLEKPRTYKSEVYISLQQPEVTASK